MTNCHTGLLHGVDQRTGIHTVLRRGQGRRSLRSLQGRLQRIHVQRRVRTERQLQGTEIVQLEIADRDNDLRTPIRDVLHVRTRLPE